MLRLNFCLFRKRLGGGVVFGAVMGFSLISGNPVLGFLLRAAGRLRSDDLPLTRRLLCQLSYGSITGILHACPVAGFPKNQPDKGGKKNRSVLVEKEPSTGFGPVTCALRGRCSAS